MRSIGPAVIREQSPAFLRNSNGRSAHGFDGLLFQPQTRAPDDVDIGRAAVSRHDQLEHDRALVLGLARFIRVLWVGAISAARIPHAAGARPEDSASGTAAESRTQAPAGAAADASALACADAA